MNNSCDVIVIGAGAAGMMCAAQAGQRGRKVRLIDHAQKIGEKIRISGGGRCNFTNLGIVPERYVSANPHFCKSALKQFTAQDFITLVKKHGISYHEKTLGQLFCDDSAQQIIDMLHDECAAGGVVPEHGVAVSAVTNSEAGGYEVRTAAGEIIKCTSLVVATGGLSIPKIGASKFGYEIARQFGLNVLDTRAGLVPLTFQSELLELCKTLSGLSVQAIVSCGKAKFAEGLLFTHRGLSGPSILQISSYWREGQDIVVNLAPETDVFAFLKERKAGTPKQDVQTALSDLLPKRLAQAICERESVSGKLAEQADKALAKLGAAVNEWRVRPSGTEGYRTAEVTLGGVDTAELSSKTMEAKKQPGLYFIGEVVDVTGWLGGYNFQWAWSSGFAAGQAV